jgi:hypothetical protein
LVFGDNGKRWRDLLDSRSCHLRSDLRAALPGIGTGNGVCHSVGSVWRIWHLSTPFRSSGNGVGCPAAEILQAGTLLHTRTNYLFLYMGCGACR